MDIVRIKLESEIMNKVHADNGATVHFDWEELPTRKVMGDSTSFVEPKFKLNLVTFNPRHNQPFLCHSVRDVTKMSCLTEMHKYIIEHEDLGVQSWTIRWRNKGEQNEIVSYFSGKNERDVLDKFYHGKDEDTIVLSELKLNPIS